MASESPGARFTQISAAAQAPPVAPLVPLPESKHVFSACTKDPQQRGLVLLLCLVISLYSSMPPPPPPAKMVPSCLHADKPVHLAGALTQGPAHREHLSPNTPAAPSAPGPLKGVTKSPLCCCRALPLAPGAGFALRLPVLRAKHERRYMNACRNRWLCLSQESPGRSGPQCQCDNQGGTREGILWPLCRKWLLYDTKGHF